MQSTFLISTLSFLPCFTLAFSLGAANDNWALISTTLDKYTSHACRSAYETPIDCSDTLLALVASPDPEYVPSFSDLDSTCTDECRKSIDSYIRTVEEICSSPWDAALISTAAICTDCRQVQTPVQDIGKIFQYKLQSACALDRYGTYSSSQSVPDETSDGVVLSNFDYCYLHPAREGTDFPCSDTCSIDYYKTAYAYPASQLTFSHLWLVEKSNYWKHDLANGYKRALDCEIPV
ncbi:hypothetical protein FQN54_009806 [Arachnomyces sp. PD_36]|nr:hypothetical protein FQN54_009806 [Arachnomyces sp. PD_36]